MSLVTTDWVLDNLNSLKIIDASWHMPAQKRNPAEEYLNAHIPVSYTHLTLPTTKQV